MLTRGSRREHAIQFFAVIIFILICEMPFGDRFKAVTAFSRTCRRRTFLVLGLVDALSLKSNTVYTSRNWKTTFLLDSHVYGKPMGGTTHSNIYVRNDRVKEEEKRKKKETPYTPFRAHAHSTSNRRLYNAKIWHLNMDGVCCIPSSISFRLESRVTLFDLNLLLTTGRLLQKFNAIVPLFLADSRNIGPARDKLNSLIDSRPP